MCNPKYRVDAIGIRRADVQPQERRFHAVERLEAFFEEQTVKLLEIDCHPSRHRSGIKCVGHSQRDDGVTEYRRRAMPLDLTVRGAALAAEGHQQPQPGGVDALHCGSVQRGRDGGRSKTIL